MKNIHAVIAIAALSLPFQTMASNTANWTNWTGTTTGSFVQNGNIIDVSYSGDEHGNSHDAAIFDQVPNSFTSGTVTNTPSSNGTIVMYGGGNSDGNFHFSQAVVNPLLALWSVGQAGKAVSFVFDTDQFNILSQGGGHWGGGSLTQSGNSVTGYEGNGLIQFYGTYTDIHFSLPNYEYYYGATVGAPAAVPVPAALPLMASGLGFLGWGSYRRTRKTA